MRRLLQDWVTIQAERRPEATAVVLDMERMTYGKLDDLSNRLARILREDGCQKGDRICLLMPKSPAAIVGLLGIYKADCAYVPLDPSSPPSRLAKILESCEARFLLAGGPVTRILAELPAVAKLGDSISVGWMDGSAPATPLRIAFSLPDLAACSAKPMASCNSSYDPAHILFTSGSTGTPKGVVITHANVIHFVEWATTYFGLDPTDRISGHSPLHFDLSVFDIFGAFAAGAQLHLVPSALNILPSKLAEFIRASELTQWFSVPSLLTYLAKFDVVKFNDFPHLKRLLWCGEVLPTPALAYWMSRLPHVTFTNLYGPTEATIASSYYTVPECPKDETTAIPIGTACPGEELLVLTEELQPVVAGELGDLYIRGVGLSPGYWKDPERTDAVFRRNPNSADGDDRIYKTGDLARVGADGLVYFHGRSDSQIKSRGYRIELGEIEASLSVLTRLQECAVVAISTDGFEGAIICAAYVPARGTEIAPLELRTELSKLIPPYMLPLRWLCLAALPRNANGKIDRRRLTEQFAQDEARAH
jgi:amino acid adenylation domain-containing protein